MDSFNHFGDIADKLDLALSQVVRKTAKDISAKAKANAPTDTGFLRNSIYTVTSNVGLTELVQGTGIRVASKGFKSTRKKRIKKSDQPQMLPEIPPPPDDKTAYVVTGAAYGVYVNYGTRKMAARPFWEQAIDAAQPGFEAAIGKIEAKLQSLSSADDEA